jgi:hypothetical protein
MVVTIYHNNPIDFINSSQKVEINVNKSIEFVSHNQHSQENSWCLLLQTKPKWQKKDPKPQNKEPHREGENQKYKTPTNVFLKRK